MVKKISVLIISLSLVLLTLLIAGCSINGNTNTPEQVAQSLAISWSSGDYLSAYDLFVPELKSKRSQYDFSLFAQTKDKENGLRMVYDKIVLQNEKEAYAYYNIYSGIAGTQAPLKMILTEEGWKVDGFASYFSDECAEGCITKILNGKEWMSIGCETAICNAETQFTCVCICENDSQCWYDKCIQGKCSD